MTTQKEAHSSMPETNLRKELDLFSSKFRNAVSIVGQMFADVRNSTQQGTFIHQQAETGLEWYIWLRDFQNTPFRALCAYDTDQEKIRLLVKVLKKISDKNNQRHGQIYRECWKIAEAALKMVEGKP